MAPRSRHAKIAASLALAAGVALLSHPLWPEHAHPWAAHEAVAAPADAKLPDLHLAVGDSIDVYCDGGAFVRNNQGSQKTQLTCGTGAAGTTTPTATGTVGATATATKPPATGTATAMPTSTQVPPTVAPTGTTTTAMIEGVPLCADHQSTVWHPLVRRNSAGAITCTYGHEHHADPSALDDVFGPPSAWYGGSQSISYPWQTSNAATGVAENVAKHEGYKWFVERFDQCKPAFPAPEDGCVIAFRIQAHTMGSASDAVTRYHSFSYEALVEYHGVRGIVRSGGHLNGGGLVLQAGDGSVACPGVPTDPPEGFPCDHSGVIRFHPGTHMPNNGGTSASETAGWYTDHPFTSFSVTVGQWGPVDYANPPQQVRNPAPTSVGHNATGHIGNMGVQVNKSMFDPFTTNGRVTMRGFMDVHGDALTPSCTAPSATCAPLVMEAVPYARYQFNAGTQAAPNYLHDYDVLSPSTGKSLIKFPN